MIVKYYHGYIPIDQVSELCKTTRNGTSAYHLIKAAETLGFKASGFKCNLDILVHTKVILPLIAHVTIENSYYHYIVIYEINERGKYFLVGDPADKIKKISFHEFEGIFNEMILIFMPLSIVSYPDHEISLKRMFFQIICKYRSDFTNFILLSLLFTFFSVASTFYINYLVDAINTGATYSYILFIFTIFLLFNLFKIISNLFRNTILIYINQKIDFILTSETFHFILSLPYSYFHNRRTGEIISHISDLDGVKNMIGKVVITLCIDLLLTIIAGICLCMISPLLFFVALIHFVLYIGIGLLYNYLLYPFIEKNQREKAKSTSFMVEALSGFETVKGLHIEKIMYEQFQKTHIKKLSNLSTLQTKVNHMLFLKEMIDNTGYIVFILIGVYLVMEGNLTLGSLLTCAALLSYFIEPIKAFIVDIFGYKEAVSALRRVADIFMEEKETGYIHEKIKGKITCRNLEYTYNDKEFVFKKISFQIEKGSKVMLLGKSGCGKSTFLKMIMKYYTGKEGTLYLDDIDLTMYTKETIGRDIGYISQNETLFTDTLYNNITLYKKTSEKHLRKILHICDIESITSKNTLGLFMMIEENGFNLSGGEKQKIVLARMLLKNFEVYLIDEGMNQMDLGTERRILKNMYLQYPDKTFIVVSHRVDNLDVFDQVIRFEDKNQIFNVRKNKNGQYMEQKVYS